MTADGVDADPALLAAIAGSDVFVSLTTGIAPGDSTPVLPPEVAKRVQAVHEAFRSLYELGARIVLGTDAGIAQLKPHDVLPYAIAQITADGPSPLEALRRGDRPRRRACGVADRKGRIAVGADADLLVVTGNPLDDLDRLRDVRAVFRAGVRVR